MSAPGRVPPFTLKGHPTKASARWVAPYLRQHLGTLEAGLGVSLARTPNGNLIPALGAGEFGAAFLASDGRVVKITTDDAEPVFGLEVRELQMGSDRVLRDAARTSVVLLDAIVQLPGKVRHQGHDVPVYALLRESVTPVSDDADVPRSVKDALNAHFDGWSEWFDHRNARSPKVRFQMACEVIDGWEALQSEPQLAAFSVLQRHLWNKGIPYMDSHRHNFGWRETSRGAQLVLFDLGGSDRLSPRDYIAPIDGDAFDRYYPWKETLAKVTRA